MAFTKNMPTAGQFQSVSQPIIRDNFNTSDDVMNTDHYGFSDPNHPGNHKIITSIDQLGHPTAPTYPKLYATSQAGTNLGVLQYSKGPDRSGVNQVSSPLTFIQSPETAITLNSGQRTNIFDFTGITRAFARVYAGNFASPHKFNTASITWDGPNSRFTFIIDESTSLNLTFDSSGNILRLGNTSGGTLSNLYWTLTFLRIEA
jgi:hypothetical protein